MNINKKDVLWIFILIISVSIISNAETIKKITEMSTEEKSLNYEKIINLENSRNRFYEAGRNIQKTNNATLFNMAADELEDLIP